MTAALTAALIGTGMVAGIHVRAIADTGGSVRLKGVFARNPQGRAAFAARHGVQYYADFEAVATDPEIDFVILATPPDARAELVDRLIAAGKPILMEKPIERDLRRARAIVQSCEAAGLPLGLLLQHRLRPAALDLIKRIRGNALGTIATVDARIPWWRDQQYYDTPGRGTYARDGGGVLITQAIHTIDLMLQLCGPVNDVQAVTMRSALHDLEAEDFAAAALRFSCGAAGCLMASTTHFPGGSEAITVNGTEASATLAGHQLTFSAIDGGPEIFGAQAASGGGADPMAFSSGGHKAVIEDFARALRAGRAPAITGRSALAAHALIDAIARSSESGTRVNVPDTRA